MDSTLQSQEFKNIFQNSLRLNARSMSIKTLLSERNLKRIDYSPYYQRNYVWDNAKQTFFIESVILGTEIPPLILFKSGNKIEVIDGRQRFETLKRFKENQIILKKNGLKELQILDKSSFNKLSDEIKQVFLDSNIRVFEFEIINQPDLNDRIFDMVKKEIFRRYNTGITSLNREELDNAKYDDDKFSELFKDKLRKDYSFLVEFNSCFFPKEIVEIEGNNDGLITKNVDFIRKYRILHSFPISTYAAGDRTEVIDLLYDFAKTNADNNNFEFECFLELLKIALNIYKDLSSNVILNNKLIYECILWAITILKEEKIEYNYKSTDFIYHYKKNINKYSEDSSYYYGNIIERFTDTANFFESLTNINFSKYIRDESFRKKFNKLKQTEGDAAESIDDFSNLRLYKPNPISTPIDEIRTDFKSSNYLLRPSYQRQEKINIQKASSIIESILLGINLPPIFIYKRNNNIKEVVDGQQRLLAIIGFLGDRYLNEDGKLSYSKNNNFKLKGLKILTDLEGRNYSGLLDDFQNKILDFNIELIIIEEGVNEKFDPTDLFIRLNYKPYPIKTNSFEMWNSIGNYEVIKQIKEITSSNNMWFFLRDIKKGKPDRMLNEELITILSYICFNNNSSEEIIGFFLRQDRITCRLKNKKALSDFLIELDNDEMMKIEFQRAIKKTNHLIFRFGSLFGVERKKEEINEFLNVKKSKTFRRSLQDFYLIWLIIDRVPDQCFKNDKKTILSDIRILLSLLKNVDEKEVNDHYMSIFNEKFIELTTKYDEPT